MGFVRWRAYLSPFFSHCFLEQFALFPLFCLVDPPFWSIEENDPMTWRNLSVRFFESLFGWICCVDVAVRSFLPLFLSSFCYERNFFSFFARLLLFRSSQPGERTERALASVFLSVLLRENRGSSFFFWPKRSSEFELPSPPLTIIDTHEQNLMFE